VYSNKQTFSVFVACLNGANKRSREFDYLVGLPERRRLAGKQFYASLASPIA